jgi:hypothetical protein
MATETPFRTGREIYWVQLQAIAGHTGTAFYPSDGRGGRDASAANIFAGPTNIPGRRIYRVLGFVVLVASVTGNTSLALKDADGNTLGTAIVSTSVNVGFFGPLPRFFTLPATPLNPGAGYAETPNSGVPIYDAFTVQKDQNDCGLNVLFSMEIE